eukprot:840288-Pyramimonas_sp.AAC.1
MGAEQAGLPSGLFRASSREVSVGQDALDQATKKESWPKLSDISKGIIPCALSCLLCASSDNKRGEVNQCWQGLLTRPGDVIRQHGSAAF